MQLSKVIPVLAILVAVAALAVTIYLNMTVEEPEIGSTFVPPEVSVSEPTPPWTTGTQIVTPIG